MNTRAHEPLNLTSGENEILSELLASEHARLLVEIRHTDHRAFRDKLRQKLAIVEGLMERCEHEAGATAE
jgi:hypothetical protein